MKNGWRFHVLVTTGCALLGSAIYAHGFQDRKTSKDAVFSEAQAARGRSLYDDQCASCHSADLSGGGAPPLAGADFLSSWDRSPVADLVSKIATTMPANSPGGLSRPQSTDLVAYMLKVNGFPVGSSELPSEEPAQQAIAIVK